MSQNIQKKLEDAAIPVLPQKKDYAIGCIGAGFIMNDCHLVAYRNAGFNPAAITSLSAEERDAAAKRHTIKKVYDTWQKLVDDTDIEILDIAVPPDVQLEVLRYVAEKKHLKGILAQKPAAMSLGEIREIAAIGKTLGIPIAVNSNMRYDQSMRALKYALDQGLLGKPILATIEMRAIPHWQDFLKKYPRLEIYSMGIHHVDIFRYLFGDPEKITALCRTDPRTQFSHRDGIVQFSYQYKDGFIATSLDDVWAWPNEPCEKDIYIKWRVEGTEGMADGFIGWPVYPQRQPSTLRLTTKQADGWIMPRWDTVWFPDAFVGTMASLLRAVENGTKPEIDIEDNIKTIACVEACYASIQEERTVRLDEVLGLHP
ncbi:MAG: Gfo/Idh/MocA family oxidoreductase [Treponema sp.]|jgi:predicted dehydrogenase|nr:Gfo/Idh/MocA family oxidoreductase [Treponema sp.]